MDPDGGYESFHSTRSIGDMLLKDAKLDDVEGNSKSCGGTGVDDEKGSYDEDEEMGLKPSPTADSSKVALKDEKDDSIDLKPSAPPAVDLGCLPSAPPLESPLHPSPEDDVTAPPSPESSHPPEPPGFKDDPVDGGGSIPDSVALPIGLDNADRALPVASVVPIITGATGSEGGVSICSTQPVVPSSTTSENTTQDQQPTTSTTSTLDRAPTRRAPSFPRQVPTHPAPEEPIVVQSATASLVDVDPQDEREKKGSQGWKCTPCKKALYVAALVIAAVLAVGLTISLKPSSDEENGTLAEPSFASLYPNCHVFHKEWIGDGTCNGGNYNKRGCGWDGGDCIKQDWPDCHANTPEAFRGLGNGKCNTAFNVIECGFDLGDCRPNWSKDDVANLKDLMKDYPECFFEGMAIDYVGDDYCDGGQYNNEECGWDGGDCVDFNRRYPNCDVGMPFLLEDGICNGGRYNTEECGWDGEDCEEFNRRYPTCNVDSPNNINDDMCDTFGNYNSGACGWDGGDCLFNKNNGKVCVGSVRSTWPSKTRAWCQYKCMDEGYRCVAYEFNDNTDRCRIYSSFSSTSNMNNSRCYKKKDEYSVAALYPNCIVNIPSYLNDDQCDTFGNYNSAECGWDGGDCLFNKNNGKACVGTVRSTWTNKTRRWCQFKCLTEGNLCKAYDFDNNAKKCRIFSSYSSKTSRNNSKCYKKK